MSLAPGGVTLKPEMEDLPSLVKQFREATTLEERLRASDFIMAEVAPNLKAFILNKAKALGRIELADDFLQEALIRIFQRLESFQGTKSVELWGWCYQVTRNLLIDLLRSPKFRETEPLDFIELEKALEASERTQPIGNDDGADLEYALSLLRASKPECAPLLWQHYVLGFSYPEIGNMLGIAEDVARMRIKRCLERAQQLVQEKGERV